MVDWLQSHADYDMRVIFCCFDARTAQVYQTKMKMEKNFEVQRNRRRHFS